MSVGPPCSCGLRAAICGLASRKIGSTRSASSATQTSWAQTALEEEFSLLPQRWRSPFVPSGPQMVPLKARPLVVCTGGEPLLQLDEPLVDALHAAGFDVAIETNGTQVPPPGIDWICVSPKAGAPLKIRSGNELKLVFPQSGAEPDLYENLEFDHFLLQPMHGSTVAANTELAIAYCKAHPRWRLSLQTHKILRIP